MVSVEVMGFSKDQVVTCVFLIYSILDIYGLINEQQGSANGDSSYCKLAARFIFNFQDKIYKTVMESYPFKEELQDLEKISINKPIAQYLHKVEKLQVQHQGIPYYRYLAGRSKNISQTFWLQGLQMGMPLLCTRHIVLA